NTLFKRDPRDPNARDWTWNTTGTVANYLLHGVPGSKIAVAVPFYGNQYINVSSTSSHGLYGTFDNTGLDPNSLQPDQMPHPTYPALGEGAGLLPPNGPGASGYRAYWDAPAGEPYLASPSASHALASGTITTPTVIAYSSPASIGERTLLVKALHLRGA